jgi:hypothetical protein
VTNSIPDERSARTEQTAHDVGIQRFDAAENTMTRWTDLNEGGHFSALEIPDVFVNDIRTFFGEFRESQATTS